MSSNEKISNVLVDGEKAVGTTLFPDKKYLTKDSEKGIEELADTLLSENQSSTKDVEKVTDELECKKQKVNTIRRKGLNKFEGQSTGTV